MQELPDRCIFVGTLQQSQGVAHRPAACGVILTMSHGMMQILSHADLLRRELDL